MSSYCKGMAGCVLLAAFAAVGRADGPIKHSFLATGVETYILDDGGKVVWRYPAGTRDGWVLPNGDVLLAVTKNNDYPGGAAVQVTRDGKMVSSSRARSRRSTPSSRSTTAGFCSRRPATSRACWR